MNAITTLNHLAGRVADFAWAIWLQSSVLIVALFVVDLVLRNRLRAVVRYALWMLVLLKLVLPPSFAAPTGLAYWLPRKRTIEAPLPATPRVLLRYQHQQSSEIPSLPAVPPSRPKLQLGFWLVLGWLAMASGLSAWAARRSRLIAESTRRAVPAPESPTQILDACRARMGIRRSVRLRLSDTVSGAFVCGLWRPVILIPQPLAEKLSPLQWRAVLLHELAHIKRGDVLAHYAQALLQILYWWHPLLWLANEQIRRAREQAVDETVMVAMGAEAEDYPATLLEVARLAFQRPMPALGLIGIIESKSFLAERIGRLLERPVPKSASLGFAGFALVFLAGALLLPMARASLGDSTPARGEGNGPPVPPTQSANAGPTGTPSGATVNESVRGNTTVTITKNEPYLYLGTKPVSLAELQGELQHRSDQGPAVRTNTNGPARSNADNRQPTNSLEAGARRDRVPVLGDLPFLSRFFRSESQPAKPDRAAIQARLNQIILPEIVFDNTPLPEVLQWLAGEAKERDLEGKGIRFLIDPIFIGPVPRTTFDPITGLPLAPPSPQPFDINSVKIRIKPALRNVRLGDAIDAIVKTADKVIRYSIEDYAVVFSQEPAETQQRETRIFRVNSKTLLEGLSSVRGITLDSETADSVHHVQNAVRDFLGDAGVSVQPPNMVYFNNRTGVLMVRATATELEVVQRAIEALNPAPAQITIEAKFMEMPTGAALTLGLDLPPPSKDSNTWARVLTAAQMRTGLRAAEQLAGVDILTTPKITTLSGRQSEIQAAEIRTIVNGINPQALNPPGAPPTNGIAAQTYLTSQLPVGPTLDVIPYVAADGFTIQLTAMPRVTEFLRYDTTLDGGEAARVRVDGKEQKVPLPLPLIRTRSMQASAEVYDGQTLVLANPVVSKISRQPNGQSLTNAIPEDAGKRLVVFITPTLIDPAGSPIHTPGHEPFPADRIPASH